MPPDLAPMLVAIVFILTIGFISIVRPIAKPLVRLLEAMILEREQLPPKELGDIHRSLEQIEGRLHLMEERQSFYEALRAPKEAATLITPRATGSIQNTDPDRKASETDPGGGPTLLEEA